MKISCLIIFIIQIQDLSISVKLTFVPHIFEGERNIGVRIKNKIGKYSIFDGDSAPKIKHFYWMCYRVQIQATSWLKEF